MRIKTVLYLTGQLLKSLSPLILIPIVISSVYGEREFFTFLIPSAIALASGLGLSYGFASAKEEPIRQREGFALVSFAWLSVCLLGSLPYIFSGAFANFADAFFESVSGFTGTGASVLTDIEAQSHALLFWRSFTHWLGGMGIIVLGVAILPQLAVGGMQLMQAETPGPTVERLTPRIISTAKRLWGIYVLFSIIEVLALYFAGMPLFDSLCHTFGTMATGGFSTRTGSIGAYGSPAMEMIIVIFMFLGGTNFVLHYNLLKGNPKKFLRDPEFRFYLSAILLSFLIVTFSVWGKNYTEFGESARRAIFQVVSVATATGYATENFDLWPPLAKGVLLVLMFIGGCTGSTSGGMKQLRVLIILKKTKQSLRNLTSPRALIPLRIGRKSLSDEVASGIVNFILAYILLFAGSTLFMLGMNLELVSAVTSVGATLGNLGPGLGLVGPSQNYAFLPSAAKIVLSLNMILGRLEIFTLLVLFLPSTWQK